MREFKPDNQGDYLYRRDFAGQGPGLFLTGTIPQAHIKQINSTDDNNAEFIRLKILWFARGKLVNKPNKLNTLSEYRKNELTGIFEELKNKGEDIAKDVIEILIHKLPEKTLLTIMIKYNDTIINYLAIKYVIDPSASIAKDTTSYIFTLGLSFGYMLARKNLENKDGEEIVQ